MSGLLAHSPADVTRRLPIQLGLGTDPDAAGQWPIFAAGEPNTPDSVVTVYDTQGLDDGREMVAGYREEHHGTQVRIRAASHSPGYVKANAIGQALDRDVSMTEVAVGTSRYLVYAVNRTTDVISLGKEVPPSKRHLFTINATVALHQLA